MRFVCVDRFMFIGRLCFDMCVFTSVCASVCQVCAQTKWNFLNHKVPTPTYFNHFPSNFAPTITNFLIQFFFLVIVLASMVLV